VEVSPWLLIMTRAAQMRFGSFLPKEVTSDRRRTYHLLMPSTRKKRKVSDLTVDDANTLLRTLAEFQEQLDEEDEDLPRASSADLSSGARSLKSFRCVALVVCVLTYHCLTFPPYAHSFF
jgi:hypothetical protein